MQSKRIAFFGTPQFTVEFLELFKSLNLEIAVVVTGEDKPVGRGMQMRSPGPKVWGEKNNIQVLQPKKLDDDFYNILSSLNIDLSIVIAYGKIIPERVINVPKLGTINLHYSLLPKYRGASPVESAILNNESVTGITIQQMVYKLDAGDILFQEEVNIGENDTTSDLRGKLNARALEIFPQFLNNLFEGKITPIPQNESEATSCGKFIKDDLNVTLELQNKDLEGMYRKYRTFDKKIFFFKNGLRIKITNMNKNGIQALLPESKKEISAKDFENSYGEMF